MEIAGFDLPNLNVSVLDMFILQMNMLIAMSLCLNFGAMTGIHVCISKHDTETHVFVNKP